MADKYQLNFTCPICGGHQLNVDMSNDNSVASCGSCGSEFGRWGDIKANLGINETPKAAEEKPTFKGFSNAGFKVGR